MHDRTAPLTLRARISKARPSGADSLSVDISRREPSSAVDEHVRRPYPRTGFLIYASLGDVECVGRDERFMACLSLGFCRALHGVNS